MTIEPPYLVRRLEQSDATSLYQVVRASLAELNYSLPWCKLDYALEDAVAWISYSQSAWQNRSEFPLGIFDACGQVIGGTGISQINKPSRMGNIGYWVGTPYVGRGIARFAAKQAARLGFEQLGLTRLEIVALTHNLASQKVAEALGATRECVARNRLYCQDAPHDAVVYSLIPSDVLRWHLG